MTKTVQPIRVWDIPTRLVHWLLVICFAVSWITAEQGNMDYHRYSGYVLFGLLLFRLFWGVVGSSTARFAQFVHGPGTVLQYLRSGNLPTHDEGVHAGHNPLGALSVVLLLTLLVSQVVLGMFAVDVDGLESGPWSIHVSFETGRWCAAWHARVFTLLQIVVALHLAAIVFHLLVKRTNLIRPMLTGKKHWHGTAPVRHVTFSPWWLAWFGAFIVALLVRFAI